MSLSFAGIVDALYPVGAVRPLAGMRVFIFGGADQLSMRRDQMGQWVMGLGGSEVPTPVTANVVLVPTGTDPQSFLALLPFTQPWPEILEEARLVELVSASLLHVATKELVDAGVYERLLLLMLEADSQ